MKKYILYLLLFQNFVSFSQYYMNDGFYYVNKPDFEEAFNFYKNEFEFNPADLANPLVQIEKEAKENKNLALVYSIRKQSDNLVKVTLKVNDLLFSESFYKNGLLHGKKIIYNGKGAVFHEINFEKGKANGTYKIYSDFDELVLETEFKNNLKHGKRTLYKTKRKGLQVEGIYEKGILVSDLTFTEQYGKFIVPKNAKKGKVKHLTLENNLVAEFELIGNGLLHGMAVVYNLSNGKPYSKVPYNYDKKNGVAEFYNRKGELLTKNEFKNDQKIGKHQNFYDDDQLKSEQVYDDFGNPIGVWTVYFNNGKPNSVKSYNVDGSNQTITYDGNGIVTSISDYAPNSNEPNHIQHFEKGALKGETYKENNKTTVTINYYDSGEVFSKEQLKQELYEREYFEKSGKTIHINKINENGKRIGKHLNANIYNDVISHYDETYYDDFGNKIKHIHKASGGNSYETNFRNDNMHGLKTTRNSNNEITKEEYYYESNKKSEIVTKQEFQKRIKAEK